MPERGWARGHPPLVAALTLAGALLAGAGCGAPAPTASVGPGAGSVAAPGDAPVGTAAPGGPRGLVADASRGSSPDAPGGPPGDREPRMFIGTTSTAAPPGTLPPPNAGCAVQPDRGAPPGSPGVPPALADPAVRAALDTALTDLERSGRIVGASVWTDANGEVLANEPAAMLEPASNQKLLTAFGALELLDRTATFTTVLVATGPTVDGTIEGDLILVGGGDATLTKVGPHSLEALARQLADAGVTEIGGHLLVDESRYDTDRMPEGWPQTLTQANVGSLSALVVDRNRNLNEPLITSDPAIVAARELATELGKLGITVQGSVQHGQATPGVAVATLQSPPVDEVVRSMLTASDNLSAELLVKEIGLRHAGTGSTREGADVIDNLLAGLCGLDGGTNADGSGLSSLDRQSATTIRRLLLAARSRPWFPTFQGGLPLSGRSGTLATRLNDPATAGKVRAKSGATANSAALSGYLTSARGTPVTFSVLVNGPAPGAQAAIDRFVTTLVATL